MNLKQFNNVKVNSIPTLNLVPISSKLAIKIYEEIAILYLIPALILLLAFNYIGNYSYKSINNFSFNGNEIVGLVLALLWLVISAINIGPTIYLRLHASRDENVPKIVDCYKNGLRLSPRILLTFILLYVTVAIGLILLIFPGIILLRKYFLAPYYAADNPDLSLIEVFKISSTQSKSFRNAIYSTLALLILIGLMFDIFNSNVFTKLITTIIDYLFIFIPALRYNEISTYFAKKHS